MRRRFLPSTASILFQGRDEGYDQTEMNHPVMKADPRAERRSSLKNPNISMNANANMNVSFDM
jgi:hypothetical protein